MNPRLLAFYYRLPTAVRSAVATAQGARLRWWRRGPGFDEHVAAALERDGWTAEQWSAWREPLLGRLLEESAQHVPYYREQWQARRRRGDRASWSYLENWPLLEKDALRAQPAAFLSERAARPLLTLHTSGTTGKPLTVWQSRAALTAWYALIEARRLRWFGVSERDRWALIGGQLVAPVEQTQPPFWVWNAALRQLYMSSYHLSERLAPAYLEALTRYRVRYLWGYSSSLHALARAALASGRADWQFAVSLTSAEPLWPHQRAAVQAAFGPVCETYGMTEIAAAASECPHGRLHEWPDAGFVEFLDGDRPVSPGQAGDLIATGLINWDMPLIRYRVGDRAAAAEPGAVCACGRRLPLWSAVEGRSDDLLYTRDGRRIGRLDPVFKSDLPILEAQIIQESLDRVRVRLVPAADYTPQRVAGLVDELRLRMGDVRVVLEPVAAIPRGPNGKFKAVVCLLSAAERERVNAAADSADQPAG